MSAMLSRPQRIRDDFHRLGLFLAGLPLVIGVVLMAFDVVDLDLWHVRRADILTDIGDLALGALGVLLVCSALWAIVRGLGWVVSRFFADTN
jgi:hypothetical protein